MAVNNVDTNLLDPRWWAATWDTLDEGVLNFQNDFARNRDITAGKPGTTVTVPITPNLGKADVYDPNTGVITKTPVTQETADVTLDTSVNKSPVITRTEMTNGAYNLREQWAPGIFLSIVEAVNDRIYLEAIKSHYIVDARTTFDADKLVDARGVLTTNRVSPNARMLRSGPDDDTAMMKFDEFVHLDITGQRTQETGQHTRKYGFDMALNHTIVTYTPADVLGAVSGNYTTENTILVTAFDDDANPIRPGDIFTVAGEADLPLHIVQSTVQTAGDTTSITFETKHDQVNGSKANTAVITVIPTHSMLGFVPNALAVAIKPYAVLPAGVGAEIVQTLFAGIPVSTAIFHESLNLVIHADALFGAKLIEPKRIVRIIR